MFRNIPSGIKIIHSKNLYHIRWPHGREINKGTGFKTTIDLCKEFPSIMTLKQCIPYVDTMKEDSVTPRISFSTTLVGAGGSLGFDIINGMSYIGIYKPAQAIDGYFPLSGSPPPEDKRFYVHDAATWGEVWALRPITVELQKIIFPGEPIKI